MCKGFRRICSILELVIGRKYSVFAMDVQVTLQLSLILLTSLLVNAASDTIVFPGETNGGNVKITRIDESSVIPQDISKEETNKTTHTIKPRFGFEAGGLGTSFNIGIQPTNGGISGTASFSGSYGGPGHSGSHSQSFNFQAGVNGFSASQAGSQASSFNSNLGPYGYGRPSVSASQASSQASGFSAGVGGTSGSAASSQASSFGFQGSGVNVGGSSSSSNSNGFSGSHGPGGGFGYSPSGGSSSSSSQSGGASFNGYSGYPNEILSPDYIRHYYPDSRRNTSIYRRRNPNNWLAQAFAQVIN